MIIYGHRLAHIGTDSSDANCPNCGEQGGLKIHTFRRHVHIFWIPLFPIGKKSVTECTACNTEIKKKMMAEPLRLEVQYYRKNAKGPLWQFSGLALIFILVIVGIVAVKNQESNEQEYLDAPLSGDVYEQKLGSNSYTSLKVTAVDEDSVYVAPNEYEINRAGNLSELDKEENYMPFSYGIHRDDLKAMYEADEILQIRRR